MPRVNDLIEWDSLGTTFSLYIKHHIDDDGRKGVTMIFEDVTAQKVTEIAIPSRKFPSFLRAVNDGANYNRSII